MKFYQQAYDITVYDCEMNENKNGVTMADLAHDIEVHESDLLDNTDAAFDIKMSCYNINTHDNNTN
jgi:hypothetical protein